MKSKANIALYILALCMSIMVRTSYAQNGDDGWDNRVIDDYESPVEKARESLHFIPDFHTQGNNPLHAYIDPDIPFNNAEPQTNGDFNINFVRTFTPYDSTIISLPVHENLNHDIWDESINYLDGHGRLMQEVIVKASPYGQDIITPVKYDSNGLQINKYLPYIMAQAGTNGPGGYRANDLAEQVEYNNYFYNGQGQSANTKIEYDHSPMNRVLSELGPGDAWRNPNKKNEIEYSANSSSEVFRFRISPSGDLQVSFYHTGVLYKVKTTDENGNLSIEYKDINQRTVLKKSYNGSQSLRTYYAYDDRGLLRYVLPPLASTNIANGQTYSKNLDWVKQLCYYYEYDSKRRMKFKRLPGAEPQYMVYNKVDLLVLSQDGNMRQDKMWAFTKYDAMNRPVMTGLYQHADSLNQSQMQQIIDAEDDWHEDPAPNSYFWHTNQAFPDISTNGCKVYTVNFYDRYTGDTVCTSHPFEAGQVSFTYLKTNHVKGQITQMRIRLLDNPEISRTDTLSYLTTANYYDEYLHLIQSVSDNHLSGKDIISNQVNFTGDVLQTRQNHTSIFDTLNFYTRFSFDNGKRLIKTEHKIDNGTWLCLSKQKYDELGQLKRKKLHLNGGSSLQILDYSYNIRSWMTRINNPDALGSDLFAMKLDYTQSPKPQFNGNISGMSWNTGSKGLNAYSFRYDGINRLDSAFFSGTGNNSTAYTYDANGNIEKLLRYGKLGGSNDYGIIDSLRYTYTGNQLKSVTDAMGSAQNNGFSDNGQFGSSEYFYDANGNMQRDINKNLWVDDYNFMNLPQKIRIISAENNTIAYLYDASGTKRAKQTKIDGSPLNQSDYIANFVYENNQLQFILTSEGRIMMQNEDTYEYQYFLKDHLGNTRITMNQNGTVLQEDAYYPFGMNIAGLSSANSSPENKYKYNGKELQDEFELDWYDYGARFYDAALGRWHSVDPKAEEYYSQSPYHFSGNNPIYYVDDNGMNYDGYTIDDEGNINRVNDTGGDEYDVLYTENDYNVARQETKENGNLKNEYGNPEPANSERVSSGTFDASNKVTIESSNGTAKGLKVDNQTDAQAIFKFCADNFSVEYGIVTGVNGNTQSIIHTSGSFEYTLTGDVANYMLNKGFFILETNHSHPGNTIGGQTPSGFYSDGTSIKPLRDDAKSAAWIDQENGWHATHLMYHPQSGKTYQYNSKRYVEKK